MKLNYGLSVDFDDDIKLMYDYLQYANCLFSEVGTKIDSHNLKPIYELETRSNFRYYISPYDNGDIFVLKPKLGSSQQENDLWHCSKSQSPRKIPITLIEDTSRSSITNLLSNPACSMLLVYGRNCSYVVMLSGNNEPGVYNLISENKSNVIIRGAVFHPLDENVIVIGKEVSKCTKIQFIRYEYYLNNSQMKDCVSVSSTYLNIPDTSERQLMKHSYEWPVNYLSISAMYFGIDSTESQCTLYIIDGNSKTLICFFPVLCKYTALSEEMVTDLIESKTNCVMQSEKFTPLEIHNKNNENRTSAIITGSRSNMKKKYYSYSEDLIGNVKLVSNLSNFPEITALTLPSTTAIITIFHIDNNNNNNPPHGSVTAAATSGDIIRNITTVAPIYHYCVSIDYNKDNHGNKDQIHWYGNVFSRFTSLPKLRKFMENVSSSDCSVSSLNRNDIDHQMFFVYEDPLAYLDNNNNDNNNDNEYIRIFHTVSSPKNHQLKFNDSDEVTIQKYLKSLSNTQTHVEHHICDAYRLTAKKKKHNDNNNNITSNIISSDGGVTKATRASRASSTSSISYSQPSFEYINNLKSLKLLQQMENIKIINENLKSKIQNDLVELEKVFTSSSSNNFDILLKSIKSEKKKLRKKMKKAATKNNDNNDSNNNNNNNNDSNDDNTIDWISIEASTKCGDIVIERAAFLNELHLNIQRLEEGYRNGRKLMGLLISVLDQNARKVFTQKKIYLSIQEEIDLKNMDHLELLQGQLSQKLNEISTDINRSYQINLEAVIDGIESDIEELKDGFSDNITSSAVNNSEISSIYSTAVTTTSTNAMNDEYSSIKLSSKDYKLLRGRLQDIHRQISGMQGAVKQMLPQIHTKIINK